MYNLIKDTKELNRQINENVCHLKAILKDDVNIEFYLETQNKHYGVYEKISD